MGESKAAYEHWHARLEVDDQADTPWHRLVRDYLTDEELRTASVLEIGCGRGGFACWLASQSSRPKVIVAADFAETAVEKGRSFAREHGILGIEWRVADIQKLAFRDSSFDLVISCETIEHVPEPKVAIRELARVLRPGGRLIVTTPNYFGPMGLYRAYRRVVGRPFTEEGQPINHLMMLPVTRSWVKRSGLRVIRTDGVGHYLPFPGRVPIRLHVLDRLRPLTCWFGLHSALVAEKPV